MQKQINGFWFQPKRALKFAASAVLISALCGCFGEQHQPEQKTSVSVKMTGFDRIDGWKSDDFAEVIPVFAKNCAAVLKNKNTFLYNSEIKIKTADYRKICRRFGSRKIEKSEQMRKFLEKEFIPYEVAGNGSTEGKFTSYYEAEINASFEKTARYKYPIYGRPSDLIEVNLKDFGADMPDKRLVGRVENGKFIPYYKRREIENKGINAPVIMWGDDPVDIHFMQIQGSAVAHMSDGSDLRIGYADNNGHKFRGIGSILLAEKIIKPQDASMIKIREWLRKNPQKAADLMAENERFIFQRLSDADGPVGAMGIPLTAGRSMAVDKDYIPLGAIMWLDTKTPENRKIRKIVFAQDIGSAIKGAVRGDYFWGYGEEALKEAGKMNSAGRYYILAPRSGGLKAGK